METAGCAVRRLPRIERQQGQEVPRMPPPAGESGHPCQVGRVGGPGNVAGAICVALLPLTPPAKQRMDCQGSYGSASGLPKMIDSIGLRSCKRNGQVRWELIRCRGGQRSAGYAPLSPQQSNPGSARLLTLIKYKSSPIVRLVLCPRCRGELGGAHLGDSAC